SCLLEREDCTLVAWYRSSTHLAREGRMTVTIGRRELLAALGGAAVVWPLAAHAQQRRYRIGHLAIAAPTDTPPPPPANWNAFVPGLREAGYTEVQNIDFDHRSAHDQTELFPQLAF